MPAISVLMKPASSMCNMSCDYCFYCDEARNRQQESYGFMTEDTLKNVIRRTIMRAEGSATYAYQGGEPTLRGLDFYKKAVEYQKRYNKNRVKVFNALQTNGFLLDRKWCDFLRENHFLVGLSIDGTKEIHDSMRHTKQGEDTYDRIKAAADLMDQCGVEYNILTVVTAQMTKRISEVYQNYKRNGWKYQQYIACLDPLHAQHGAQSYSLNPEEYGRFLCDLFDLWYQDLLRGEQPVIRQFENWVGLAAGYMAESCEQRGICGIQTVVEADGSVYPCDFYMLDEYRLGNFNVDLLDQINRKRTEIGFVERSCKIVNECRGCEYYKLCRGGCQRNRDWITAEGAYKNYLCSGYKLFFEHCGDRIEKIGKSLLYS